MLQQAVYLRKGRGGGRTYQKQRRRVAVVLKRLTQGFGNAAWVACVEEEEDTTEHHLNTKLQALSLILTTVVRT